MQSIKLTNNGNGLSYLVEATKTEKVALAEQSSVLTVYGDEAMRLLEAGITNNGGVNWSFTITRVYQGQTTNTKYWVNNVSTSATNGLEVTIDGVGDFFYKFANEGVYTTLDGSHTAAAYLDLIFGGQSNYTYSLDTTIAAYEKSNYGMDLRKTLFDDFISDTDTEFYISGTVVHIVDKVGGNFSQEARKGFNSATISYQFDGTSFVTHQKGFGNYIDPSDTSKGRYSAEYTSPLAATCGIIDAKPLDDKRYGSNATILAKLEKTVNASFAPSVTLTLYDMKSLGYDCTPVSLGNYVKVIDAQSKLVFLLRVISITYTIDTNNKVTEASCTVGKKSLSDSYTDALSSLTNGKTASKLKRIADGLSNLKPSDVKALASNLAEDAPALNGLGDKLDGLNNGINAATADADKANKGVNDLDGRVGKLENAGPGDLSNYVTKDGLKTALGDYATKVYVDARINATLGSITREIADIMNTTSDTGKDTDWSD